MCDIGFERFEVEFEPVTEPVPVGSDPVGPPRSEPAKTRTPQRETSRGVSAELST